MGRYYDGDIEGKFWFGVQDSGDAVHFGAEEQEPEPYTVTEDGDEDYHEGFVDYRIKLDNFHLVQEGIEKCKKDLGRDYKILASFFAQGNGYNDEMIVKHYKDVHNLTINENYVRSSLEVFARLDLGLQILVFFNENPGEDCVFTAEM